MGVRDDDMTAGSHDAGELRHDGAEVGHVRQRQCAHDEIDGRVGQWQGVELAKVEFGSRDLLLRQREHLRRAVDTDDAVTAVRQAE